MTADWSIVADVGGTNVRFATATTNGTLQSITASPLGAHESFCAALVHYMAQHHDGALPRSIAIGAAGPVNAAGAQLTNAPWSIATAEVARFCRTGVVRIVNDLEAVARAIPVLTDAALTLVRAPSEASVPLGDAPALAINVGTGCGAAAVRRVQAPGAVMPTWLTTATEAGHMSLPAHTAELLAPDRHSLEDVLSGAGLRRLANEIADDADAYRSSADVTARPDEPAASKALERFGWLLGHAARDLVLAHGAWAGVYLVGSVVDGWMGTGSPQPFAIGFATPAEGPMAAHLARVPIFHIHRPDAALIGLAQQVLEI